MVHTSPLDQPGAGDAGGMNIYVVESAERMAAMGVSVDIFTRRHNPDLPDIVELSSGVRVRHLNIGACSATKEELPASSSNVAILSSNRLSVAEARPTTITLPL